MNFQILSWNGNTNIAYNGSDYVAQIPDGPMANLHNQAAYVDRTENYPYLSTMVLPAHSFQIRVTLPAGSASSISARRETLKGIFNPTDFTPHKLIAQDSENSNKQWYLTGVVADFVYDPTTGTSRQSGLSPVSYLITLALSDPIWRSVTVNSNTTSITATGQQWTITPAGNIQALPKFTITPTSIRTNQWLYSRWVSVYNNAKTGQNGISNGYNPAPLTNYPVELTGGLNTTTLVNDTTVSNQINQGGGIGAGDTTIPINTAVGGGLPNSGMGYVGTEQISWTSNTGGTSLTGVTRGIGGTTAATHANGAVIARSKMLANGNDILVLVDGTQANFWVTGANTSSTKIWTNLNLAPNAASLADQRVVPTLRTALPNNGTTVTVQFNKANYGSLQALKALKAAANPVFLIGSEAFTYSQINVDLVNYQITSCSRAQKTTSFAAHSAGATIIPLDHDIWVLYGNAGASAPFVDDSQKPLLNLSSSTNTSWVFSNFFDSSNPAKPGTWAGVVQASIGQQSQIYTGNQQAFADPATEMGCRLMDFQQANTWKSETATILWSFTNQCGIQTVSAAGSKYAFATSSWPAVAGLQKFGYAGGVIVNGWITVWTEAVPGVAQTWTAFTRNGQSLGGTFTKIRFALIGTISASANQESDIQFDTLTLALNSSNTPTTSLGTEQSSTNYYMSATILNTSITPNESLILSISMPLNTALTIDTAAKTATLADGTNVIAGVTLSSVRSEWLRLPVGANVLEYDDSGTGNVTVQTQWNDRSL